MKSNLAISAFEGIVSCEHSGYRFYPRSSSAEKTWLTLDRGFKQNQTSPAFRFRPVKVFVEQVKGELGVKALHRDFEQLAGAYALREASESYAADFERRN
jgi:hypothetical protein